MIFSFWILIIFGFFYVKILQLCSYSAFHQKMLHHFIKYVTFSFLEMEKLMHREVKGSDITSNIVLYCLISVIINEYALLLNVMPWEQLRDGNEYVLTCDGWSLLRIIRKVSVDVGVFTVAVLGPPGDCGPIVRRTVKMRSAFLKEFLCRW